MNGREPLEFLFASPSRLRVLDELRARDASPATLEDATSVSRTTVHRCLRGFEEYGWVQRTDGAYELTDTGAFVLRRATQLRTDVASMTDLTEFVRRFDHADELPVPCPNHARDDGTVETSVATPNAPQAPVSFLVERLPTDARRIRGLYPVVIPRLNDAFADVLGDGTTVEVVQQADALDETRRTQDDAFEAARDTDRLDVFAVDRSFEFGLVIDPEHVFVGAYGEFGQLQACLYTDDDAVRSWAESTYCAYRSDAVSLAAWAS